MATAEPTDVSPEELAKLKAQSETETAELLDGFTRRYPDWRLYESRMIALFGAVPLSTWSLGHESILYAMYALAKRDAEDERQSGPRLH